MKKLIAAIAIAISTQASCLATKGDVYIATAMQVSNTAAISIESAQSIAVILYKNEQETVIAQALVDKVSKDEVKSKIATVRKSWASTWVLFEKARTIHRALATLVAATDAADKKAIERMQGELLFLLDQIQRELAVKRQGVYQRWAQ